MFGFSAAGKSKIIKVGDMANQIFTAKEKRTSKWFRQATATGRTAAGIHTFLSVWACVCVCVCE